MARPGRIRIGVGGWTFEPWRGPFYPERHPHAQELAYASRHVTSIEINGTFYGSQSPESFAKWHDETPDDFVFALKAPRFATNRKVLVEAGASIERFLESGILALKDKLGPINWQMPPTKAFVPADFEGFLALLPPSFGGRTLRHAVELRHASFCTAETIALARDYGVAIVVAGDSSYPQIPDPTAPFVYVRVMGTQESEAQGYSAQDLDLWAARAKDWAAGRNPAGLASLGPAGPDPGPRDVFLYVISGDKVRNPAAAMALLERTR